MISRRVVRLDIRLRDWISPVFASFSVTDRGLCSLARRLEVQQHVDDVPELRQRRGLVQPPVILTSVGA